MIDQISLYIPFSDIKIKPSHNLTLQPARINPSTGEVYRSFDISGELIAKAYSTDSDIMSLNITPHGAWIRSNPRKVVHGNNYTSLSHDDFLHFRKSLLFELGKYLVFESDKIQINKMELAYDVEVGKAFNSRVMWRSLTGQYLKPKEVKGGLYFENNSKEYSFYNKTEEVKSKSNKDIDKNMFRVELRLKNKRSVQSNTIYKYLDDLVNEDKFIEVENCFHKSFTKDFKTSVDCAISSQKRSNFDLNIFKNKFGKNYLQKFVMTLGVKGVLGEFGTVEGYKEFLKNNQVSKHTIRDHIKMFKSLSEVMVSLIVLWVIIAPYSLMDSYFVRLVKNI